MPSPEDDSGNETQTVEHNNFFVALPTSRLDAEFALYALDLSESRQMEMILEKLLLRDVYPIEGLRVYWIAGHSRVDVSKVLEFWL